MRKSSFAKLVLFVMLAFVFAIGMCMCLLPEWNMFIPGVITTAVGGGALLIWGIAVFFARGLYRVNFNVRLVGKILYAAICVLTLGAGMAMIMALDMFAVGICVGGAGLLLALFAIPMFIGFK